MNSGGTVLEWSEEELIGIALVLTSAAVELATSGDARLDAET